MHFNDFDLNPTLQSRLDHLGLNEPTPIQQQAIPIALTGHDILGSAQTGTGKTYAFGVPIVQQLMDNHAGKALIITPTRELAAQVIKALQALLGAKSPVKSVLLIGGDSLPKQLAQLRKKPRLIVGTPGRLNDLLERGDLNLNNTQYLVLDETDRMLDMGFSIQINNILKHMQGNRQTMLFSATLPKNIMQLAGKYLNNPERIAVGTVSNPADNVEQTVRYVNDPKKYSALIEELDAREGSVLVFVKTKAKAERIAKKLNQHYHADALHGDLRHSKRERVTHAFRQGKFRILVATDIAARGLDIPHIEHVISYDLPQCPEDYIHRIGRTGRAGKKGDAICFISSAERGMWGAIYRLMYPDAPKIDDENQPMPKSGRSMSKRGGGKRSSNKRGASKRSASKRVSSKKVSNKRDGDKKSNNSKATTPKTETATKTPKKSAKRDFVKHKKKVSKPKKSPSNTMSKNQEKSLSSTQRKSISKRTKKSKKSALSADKPLQRRSK